MASSNPNFWKGFTVFYAIYAGAIIWLLWSLHAKIVEVDFAAKVTLALWCAALITVLLKVRVDSRSHPSDPRDFHLRVAATQEVGQSGALTLIKIIPHPLDGGGPGLSSGHISSSAMFRFQMESSEGWLDSFWNRNPRFFATFGPRVGSNRGMPTR